MYPLDKSNDRNIFSENSFTGGGGGGIGLWLCVLGGGFYAALRLCYVFVPLAVTVTVAVLLEKYLRF